MPTSGKGEGLEIDLITSDQELIKQASMMEPPYKPLNVGVQRASVLVNTSIC